jgi:lysophospholipase L1-like esterase
MTTTMGAGRRALAALVMAAAVAACGGGGGGNTGSTGAGTRTPANFDFGNNDPRKVTAFGDSITVGELGDRGQLRRPVLFRVTSNNYPNNLQAMLRGLDPSWRVVNRGVSGETAETGVRRFPGVLGADRPGFVLIMEGTNDVERRNPTPQIVANLQSMVDQAQGNHSVPVIGTIPPLFRNDPLGQAIINDANGQIRSFARARGVTLAEIFDGMNDRSLFATPSEGVNDPLHPNERGYQVMAGIWFEAMQKTIPNQPPPPAPPAPGGGGGPPPTDLGQRVKKR